MKNRCSTTYFTLVIFLTLLFTTITINLPSIAQETEDILLDSSPQKTEVANREMVENSVLNIIPENALGIIYCPSLMELDNTINDAALELVPQVGESPELLAKLLANTFGAGFESLAELEEDGLDLNQDFAIFFSSLDPLFISAVVHLTDPDAMIQVIETEADGGEPTTYNDVSYFTSSDESGSFLILDNILVFSQLPEVCEYVIDITKETKHSIANNPDYTSFLTGIMNGTDQISAYFNLESVMQTIFESIQDEFGMIIDAVESDPSSMNAAPMMEDSLTSIIDIFNSVKSISATLNIDGTDVQLSPYIKFNDNPDIQETLLKLTPNELTLLTDLPNKTFVNGSFQGNPNVLTEWSVAWIKNFTEEHPEVSALYDELMIDSIAFTESLKDEWAFSVNFNESIIPDYMTIVGIKDEDTVKTSLEKMLTVNLEKSVNAMRDIMGDNPQLALYDGIHPGIPIVHQDVEIKSFILPNFGSAFTDLQQELPGMVPEEWQISYAISNGFLYLAGGNQQLIQTALDSKAQIAENATENPSYLKLIEKLGKDNNIFLGISPLTATKSILKMVANVANGDQNFGAEIQLISGMLTNIPENYSIGISGKVEDGGIGAKLLITVGDFKQLIQTVTMFAQMGM